MTKKYSYNWTCAKCGKYNEILRTKIEAAFEDDPRLPCEKCGSTETNSWSSEPPDLDEELLEIWFTQKKVFMGDQDQDIYLAGQPFSLLRGFVENPERTKARRKAMGGTLATVMYGDAFDAAEDREWCLKWLTEFPKDWRPYTMGYIKKEVDKKLAAG